MTKINWKDVGIRALKTFVQAFIAVITAQIGGVDFSDKGELQSVLVGLAISAGAAGVSAVWNGVINPLLSIKENKN